MKNNKKQKSKNTTTNDNLILGLFQRESTMGRIAEKAMDGKTHKISELKTIARGKDLMGRLFNFERRVRIAGIGKVERDLEGGTFRFYGKFYGKRRKAA